MPSAGCRRSRLWKISRYSKIALTSPVLTLPFGTKRSPVRIRPPRPQIPLRALAVTRGVSSGSAHTEHARGSERGSQARGRPRRSCREVPPGPVGTRVSGEPRNREGATGFRGVSSVTGVRVDSQHGSRERGQVGGSAIHAGLGRLWKRQEGSVVGGVAATLRDGGCSARHSSVSGSPPNLEQPRPGRCGTPSACRRQLRRHMASTRWFQSAWSCTSPASATTPSGWRIGANAPASVLKCCARGRRPRRLPTKLMR